ncbi:MAG: hypothetical protein AAF211_10140 [Myxococcota bacterium]
MASKKRPKTRPAVGRLGKTLTRRSRGRCELCDRKVGVEPYELPPWPDEPEPDRTLMTCLRCRTWLHLDTTDPVEAHFLGEAIWSEVPPVRLAAARLLIASDDLTDPWLRDAIEAAQVDPATGEFTLENGRAPE